MGNLEAQMKKMKEEISKLSVTGESGAGMVEITMNGDFQVSSLSINEAMLGKENKGTLEVLLVSAFNDASNKAKAAAEELAKKQAGLMGILGK